LVLAIYFTLATVLSLTYSYVRLKLINDQLIFNLRLGAKDSELQLLKSQVNPHFLFNTLNTLYATALEENAPKTAESTAKLANLLRYMQNDINKDFIPLENEIKYLEDYITIQKLRCEIEPQIETKFSNFENHQISPGLLIPFVENAFKYGIDPTKPSKLKVSVICDETTIHFKCVNSYDDNSKTYYKERGFGIGITNTRQRLELVYAKKHIFEIVKENNMFSVNISINTKQL
jgi:LytS/YehU family sensor histidine kinase